MKSGFFPLLLIFITSCSTTYIRLVKTDTALSVSSNQLYVYENDTLAISYKLWSEGGAVSFVVYNKLDVPLYIDWYKSGLFVNGSKNPYWRDEHKINTKSGGTSYTIPYRTWLGNTGLAGIYAGESNTLVTKEERITFIAPISSLTQPGFSLANYSQSMTLPYAKIIEADVNYVDKPKKEKIYIWEFTVSNSPLILRNFITYSIYENFSKENYIDNKFWIKEMQQMNIKQFKGAQLKDPKQPE